MDRQEVGPLICNIFLSPTTNNLEIEWRDFLTNSSPINFYRVLTHVMMLVDKDFKSLKFPYAIELL